MIRVRGQKVTIEIPRTGSEPWIHVIVQRIEEFDDGRVNVVDRWDTFNKRFSDVFGEMYPVPEGIKQNGVASIGDVGELIQTVVVMWLIERYDGVLDEKGNVVVG